MKASPVSRLFGAGFERLTREDLRFNHFPFSPTLAVVEPAQTEVPRRPTSPPRTCDFCEVVEEIVFLW